MGDEDEEAEGYLEVLLLDHVGVVHGCGFSAGGSVAGTLAQWFD